MSYEISIQYKHHQFFLKSSWLTILTPLLFLVAIPTIVVFYRFFNALFHAQSYPKHLLHVQWGRLLFFLGLCTTFGFHFVTLTDITSINSFIAILPICIGCFLSIPLLSSRIRGLNCFVKRWHQHMGDEHQSRLLVWKANMLKAQVILEMIVYVLLTVLFLSMNAIYFHESYRMNMCSL